MNRLAEVLNWSKPAVAVAFTEEMSNDDIRDITAVADVAEFRADKFTSFEGTYLVAQARRLARIPVLATIRITAEGGGWTDSEDERFGLFTTLMPYVDGVDVELMSEAMPRVVEAAHEKDKVVVVSSHDFNATPSLGVLEDSFGEANAAGADYVKFAASAKTPKEFQRLAEFTLKHRDENVIVVAMDQYGPLSRIALPVMGSHLTYAFPGKEAVALGQMSYIETDELLAKFNPR